jgi:DNA-binding transcriptional MerR regulator
MLIFTAPMDSAMSDQDIDQSSDTDSEAPTDDSPGTDLALVEPMTIDDLASTSRVPSRTIRFYQARGMMPAPEMKGRVAYYSVAHLERLRWIARLQDRGLKLEAIRDLVRRVDRGEFDVAAWLGIQEKMGSAWADDPARTMSEPELLEFMESSRPGLIADLIRQKLVERREDVYLVESPMILGFVASLERAGITIEASAAAEKLMRKHVKRAVVELVNQTFSASEKGMITPQDDEFLEVVRATALKAVNGIFAQEMQRELRERASKGKIPAAWIRRG